MIPLDPERWRRVRAALEAALELEPAACEALLAALDGDVADDVRALLAVDRSEASERFDAAVAAQAAAVLANDDLAVGDQDTGGDPPAPRAGQQLGPWRLVRLLGRGGMAEVWEAQRADGHFDQTVAIKLMKRGLDSEEIVRRFRRERQILAGLTHPAIARLYDGGVAPDGRPYLVLEKIDGEPITEWCAHRRLDLRARLALLLACCEPVAAAHRQLVVHRDLKPSNILVTKANDSTEAGAESGAQVKLLDFGIAKLLADDVEGDATRAEERVLTPAYAAPEQILGEPVSTATDVYALGVLAYELVTGRLPHRRRHLSPGKLAEAVTSESIARPSTAVLEPGDDGVVPERARERSQLARQLRGDLDAVLLTALRREPQRRYPSVDAFAADLRRFLAGRPVGARPDRTGYRLRKFVGRHRVAVAAAAIAVVSLAGALLAATIEARRAERAAALAQANERRAEGVKEFLIGLFQIADPDQSGGNLPAHELVDQAGRRLRSELAGDPQIRADLLEAVARIQRSLGRTDDAADAARRALALRERSLAPDSPAAASARATLGSVLGDQGKLDEAARVLHLAVDRLSRSERPNSLTLARARSDYGNVLFWQGKATESERIERAVWQAYRAALGPESVQTAVHEINLGILLDELDRLDEAEAALRHGREVFVRVLGADHVYVAQADLNLAVLLEQRNQFDETERLFRQALDIRQRHLGGDHMVTGQSLQLYALFLLHRGRLDEAEATYRRALAVFRHINPKHFEVGKCLNGLALIASRRGDHAGAEATLREVVALFREVLGEEHPFVWLASNNLADTIARQGRFAEAEPLERTALAHIEKLTGPDSDEAGQVLTRLGFTLRGLGRVAEANEALARARRIAVRIEGETSLRTAGVDVELAACDQATGRLESARRRLQAVAGILAAKPDADPTLVARVRSMLADLHG